MSTSDGCRGFSGFDGVEVVVDDGVPPSESLWSGADCDRKSMNECEVPEMLGRPDQSIGPYSGG